MSRGPKSSKPVRPNPYDFIWNAVEPKREPFTPHDRFAGRTGFLECKLKAETALFIPHPGSSEHTSPTTPATYIHNAANVPIVPGSTLKGLLRSLVETLGPGCWSLYNADGIYVEKLPLKRGEKPGEKRREIHTPFDLPSPFHRCSSIERLCPACRMFGMIEPKGQGAAHTDTTDAEAQRALLGKVGVDDAECQPKKAECQPKKQDRMYTVVLAPPKPHHTAWYWYTPQNSRPAGRKYYLHHPAAGSVAPSHSQLDKYIVPLEAGNTFTFRVYVTNITDEELALLVYALVLEDGMRHKIGMAKPYGFGSVHLTITSVHLYRMEDRYDRYRGRAAGRPTEGTVADFIREQRQQAISRIDADTLGQLKRIWRWPAVGRTPAYPDQGWFRILGNSEKGLDALNPRT